MKIINLNKYYSNNLKKKKKKMRIYIIYQENKLIFQKIVEMQIINKRINAYNISNLSLNLLNQFNKINRNINNTKRDK